jgi:DNA-binding LytR/AlgR family response regulator
MMITCIIVEDEPNAVQLLQDHIGKVPFLELKAVCFDAMEAMAFFKQQQADVLFLDINMPRLSGLELAAMLPAGQKIIFTTAYSEYALDSFEYHVIDYLLKPITFKRFMQAVNKLAPSPSPVASVTQVPDTTGDFIFIKSGRQVHKLEYSRILYLEAMKEYVSIHTLDEKLLVYKRMKEMETVLPAGFVRIHNSFIINLAHISQVNGSTAEVAGRELPVSSGYRERFFEMVRKRLV